MNKTVIIPFVLKFAYGIPGSLWFFALTVGAGEIITCVILGQILITALIPVRHVLFKPQERNVSLIGDKIK